MTHTPKALIVDFGGVLTTDLWDSIRACARRDGLADNALLDLLRHDPDIHSQFVGLERGEVSQTDFENKLAAAAGVSPHRLLSRMCADLRPDEPMLAAIATLREHGVRIGVLSNSWGAGYFNPYDGYELERRADAIVISDEAKLRKPEPEIFSVILDALGVDPAESVFVDDVEVNLAPAASMGMQVIHQIESHKTIAELERTFGVPLLSLMDEQPVPRR